MAIQTTVDLIRLREALEASWGVDTSYHNVSENGNPALGQCYPTSRIIQIYLPSAEIVEGMVWAGKKLEKHFWNVIEVENSLIHLDFTWSQFPHGSIVKNWKIRDRNTLGDGAATVKRVGILLERVNKYLDTK